MSCAGTRRGTWNKRLTGGGKAVHRLAIHVGDSAIGPPGFEAEIVFRCHAPYVLCFVHCVAGMAEPPTSMARLFGSGTGMSQVSPAPPPPTTLLRPPVRAIHPLGII
jgi:hypothetical protein